MFEGAVSAVLDSVDAKRVTAEALSSLGLPRARCTVFAFGKAARGMTEAAVEVLNPIQGIALGPESLVIGRVTMHAAGHPVPAPDAVQRGREVLALARTLSEEDVALALISGGGSSMLELPCEGIALEDVIETTRILLECGARISEINAVRRALSELKGGGLLWALRPARVVNLILSDVAPGVPHLVASGPTLPPGDDLSPRAVLARHGIAEKVPARVRARLRRGPELARGPWPDVVTRVVADNGRARTALAAWLGLHGLRVHLLDAPIVGEAKERGRALYGEARELGRKGEADAVVFGGETTVALGSEAGRGGRNQEMVLSTLPGFEGGAFLCFGTDGIDGSSDAAGAFVDAEVVRRARTRGLDAAEALARHDSDRFFRTVDAQIRTGPTGTNVADVGAYVHEPGRIREDVPATAQLR